MESHDWSRVGFNSHICGSAHEGLATLSIVIGSLYMEAGRVLVVNGLADWSACVVDQGEQHEVLWSPRGWNVMETMVLIVNTSGNVFLKFT